MSDQELLARLTALTRDLVMIPTTESRREEQARCFEFLQNHLESLPGLRIDHYASREQRSMVVRPEGIEVPEILLCGHIDVIEHTQPNCYHSRVHEGRIYGPGAGDMKGQIAILIELHRELQSQYPGLSIGLALTSDEERGGMDGVRYLCEEIGLRAKYVIIPDGGSLADVTIEEKGVIHARLSRGGRAAHGARPWLGDNALENLMQALMRVQAHFQEFWPSEPVEEQRNHWFPTCCVTLCETDNATANRIPDRASAVIDVRFPAPNTVERMLQQLRDLLGPEVDVEPLMTAEPTHLDPDPLFCDITTELSGQACQLVRASGGSDSRFFRQYGIPVNLSRPLVGNLHAIDEWIDMDSMVTYYHICRTYILRKLGLSTLGPQNQSARPAPGPNNPIPPLDHGPLE
jgi:succinyl-diaminopimelate desuccinylase